MKNVRKNKGITLVALVITIIILLILAGISIASLTESGLFEKAKDAKEKQDNAQELENSILADYENKINEYVSGARNESNSTWKRYMMNENGYVVGTEEVTLPERFTELYVKAEVGVVNEITLGYSYSILYDDLNDSVNQYLEGMHNGSYNICALNSTKTKLKLSEAWFGGTNVTSSTKIKIWYR